jgi:MFS family permease
MDTASIPDTVDARATTLSASGMTGRFLLLCMGIWLHCADSLMTATIAPAIVADLQGITYLNWTISLYEVGAIIAGAAAAALSASCGIRRMFLSATVLYGAGCALGALAPTMAVLIGARLAQGMGGGVLVSLCYVAVEAWFAPALWGRLFGIEAAVWGAGSLLGPLIGGVFADVHAWRGAFWVFAAQSALLFALTAWSFPRSRQFNPPTARPPTARPRWPATPLLVLSAGTLLIAEAGTATNVALAISTGATGAILLYVAARLDRVADPRLLPQQLLDLRHPVGAGLLLVFVVCAATTGFWVYGPLIAHILAGTPPLVTGYILAGEAMAWSLATLAVSSAPAAADRRLIVGGAVAITVAALGYTVALPTCSLPGLVMCGLLQGVGFGVCWPAIVQRLIRCSSPTERSLASASASTVQRIGYAVGSAAVGIAAGLSGLNVGASAMAARSAGFWIFAAFIPLLLVALMSAWRFTAATEK